MRILPSLGSRIRMELPCSTSRKVILSRLPELSWTGVACYVWLVVSGTSVVPGSGTVVLNTVVGSAAVPFSVESEPCDSSGVEQAERRNDKVIRRNRLTCQALVRVQTLEIKAPDHAGLHSSLIASVSVPSRLTQSKFPVYLLVVNRYVEAAYKAHKA